MAGRHINWSDMRLSIKLVVPLLIGILVNLASSAAYEGVTLRDMPGRLGWWIVLVPIALGLLIFDLFQDLSSERRFTTVEAAAEAEAAAEVGRIADSVLSSAVHVLVDATLMPRSNGPLNIHIFYATQLRGETVLRKARSLSYEKESLPRNYSLDYAYPQRDELIICEAFNGDVTVYRELADDHTEGYNDALRPKVDPAIRWVLACPIHVPGGQPAGVICVFGSELLFHDESSRRAFERAAWSLGEIFSELAPFQATQAMLTPQVRMAKS